jgi:serine/threonine protein phosphatase 1
LQKIFAIGDVHGCVGKLTSLMSLLPLDAKRDTLVFLGDYVDRGPDSKGMLDYLMALRKKIESVVFLSGNHEKMFLNYYRDNRDKELYLMNGGASTIISYGGDGFEDGRKMKVPESHREFLSGLPVSYETDDYLFVHAGLKPGVPRDKQNPEDMLWIRHEFVESTEDFGKIVVFGHTSFDNPLIQPNKIGVDTGAVYGGKLTAVELPSLKIYQV